VQLTSLEVYFDSGLWLGVVAGLQAVCWVWVVGFHQVSEWVLGFHQVSVRSGWVTTVEWLERW